MPRRVALVLPPLVPELHGLLYPSVPLLAAVLAAEGFAVAQHDLNRAFVRYLLAPTRADAVFRMAAGRVRAYQGLAALPRSEAEATGARSSPPSSRRS